MRKSPSTSGGNRLLADLPGLDRRHLLASGERVGLVRADVLHAPGAQTRHVYFPCDATISLMTPHVGRQRIEVGLVGDEGMLGTSLVLGVDAASTLAVVQAGGAAWKFDASQFRLELAGSAPLRLELKRYIYVMMCQLAQASACTRFHEVEERLARWLAMTRDRAHSNQFHATHEFLARMLGVRRAGITRAASALQERGLIGYSRGDVAVIDRRGLEAAACVCYAFDRRTYADIMH